MTIHITVEEHGLAAYEGLVTVCRNIRRALEPFRGKDPGVDAFFARCDELEAADRAAVSPAPAAPGRRGEVGGER